VGDYRIVALAIDANGAVLRRADGTADGVVLATLPLAPR
jgi:hypothetical protein